MASYESNEAIGTMDTNSAEVIQKMSYALMGGEEPLRKLVKRFYEIADTTTMRRPFAPCTKMISGPSKRPCSKL